MKKMLSDVVTSNTIKKIRKEKVQSLISNSVINQKLKIPYPMKTAYHFNVPPNLFQTWHTKELPPLMFNSVARLRQANPRFNYLLFDDNDCYEFIKNNFDNDVLNAYNKLKPGAYKADLWRYCILYKKGGIYLDIKYYPVNGFKLINLLEREHWVLDADGNGIYNAVMICLPGNNVLLQAINNIVSNVQNNYYGAGVLDVTGPGLLAKYFSREEKNNFDMKHFFHNSFENRFVEFNGYIVLKSYNGYINESQKYQKTQHYGVLWNNRNIYN